MCTLVLAEKFLDSTGIRSDILDANNRSIGESSLKYSLMRILHKACGINLDKLDALKIFLENAKSINDEMTFIMEELVSRTFSDDEAEAIIAFHESTFGKHFRNTMPKMIEKLADEFSTLLVAMQDKADTEIKEKFDKAIVELTTSHEFMDELVKEVMFNP
jgi:tRNA splicing ligase